MNIIRFPRISLVPAIALALSLAAPAVYADDVGSISKVNGSVNVAKDQSVSEVSVVNGTITLADGARVGGEVTTVNGMIAIGNNISAGEVTTVNGGITIGNAASIAKITSVNGDIALGTNAVIRKEISSVNGSILVRDGGQVQGNVFSVNGAIGLIRTQVRGDVENVNGDTTVGIGSTITGRLHYNKVHGISISFSKPRVPTVIVGPHAVINGELNFERPVTLWVSSSARIGKVVGATAKVFTGSKPQ